MKFATLCEKGGREKNEDSVRCVKRDGIYCFLLADGLGGQGSGEVASDLALRTIADCFCTQAEISADIMYSYLEAGQNAIAEGRAASIANADMATTVTALVTDGKTALWAHCGDSRIYRIQKNLIQEVTDDHSVAFASFTAGDISYDEIRTSPDQNKLIRCLSDGSKFRPDIYGPIKVDQNTKFLMCSDGLWEYTDENFMEKSLKKCSTPRQWLDRLSVQRARLAPVDADNYSAIAVFIK